MASGSPAPGSSAPGSSASDSSASGGAVLRPRLALAGLFLLGGATGMVDATSYLGLGRVFSANMTGDVLLLGFSSTTRPAGYSDSAVLYGSLAALLAFVAGALGGAVVARRRVRPHPLPGFWVEGLLLAAGVGLLFEGGATHGTLRYVVLILLGVSMGVQVAVVRSLGVPDVNTNVLTTAVAGLAVDVVSVAGRPARAGRRVATAVFLFLGAAAGAALEQHGPRWSALGALAVLVVSVGLLTAGGLLRADAAVRAKAL